MRFMRIGIDARLAYYQREGGIAQYTLRLSRALLQLNSPDQFVIWFQRQDRPPREFVQNGHACVRRLITPPHHPYEQWTLPLELLPQRLDVLHSPDFIPPFRRNCASVITVHDLAFMHFPRLLTRESAAYYGQIERAVQSAERIIAVSEATARDLTSLLGVRADKLSVIYEAADALYQPVADPQAIQPTLAKYGLSPPFILFVGTIEPRKNLSTLLRAFHQLRSRYKASLQLAVVGKRGWLSDDVFALLDELKLREDVKLLGPLPAHELAALYNGARCLALPSLYEGFGLTALEAISCGTPVVVSNTSSLPEVVGDAGLCLSPHDVGEWAHALASLVTDDNLHRELSQKALRRAQQFSWERAARETLEVYAKAAA